MWNSPLLRAKKRTRGKAQKPVCVCGFVGIEPKQRLHTTEGLWIQIPWPLPPLSGCWLMRSGRERKHARERGLAHVRNLGVAESLRLPLPTQRGETVRATCVSMGACAHARGRFLRKSRAEKAGFRRREPSRVELGSSRLRCPVWPSELPHVAIWGLRWPVRACPPASKQTFL